MVGFNNLILAQVDFCCPHQGLSKAHGLTMFKRKAAKEKEKKAASAKGNTPVATGNNKPLNAVPELTLPECLNHANGALQKLRGLTPGDLRVFPLINEAQRLSECVALSTCCQVRLDLRKPNANHQTHQGVT